MNGTVYYDVEFVFDENKISLNNADFDIICRTIATKNDIDYIIKEKYVKKVALKSK
jgi:hypothetical protein